MRTRAPERMRTGATRFVRFAFGAQRRLARAADRCVRHELGMRVASLIAVTVLLGGCARRDSAPLTAEQAQSIAVQLANSKASTLYRCQPFSRSQAARFTQGRWVWSDRQGYGAGDIEATVELAADGSTNSVDLKVLDNRAIPLSRRF